MKLRRYIKDNFPLNIDESFKKESPEHARIAMLWEENSHVECCTHTTHNKVVPLNEELQPVYAIAKIRAAIESLLLEIIASSKYQDRPPDKYLCKLLYDYQITYYTHSDKYRIHVAIAIEPNYISLFCDKGHRYDKNRTCPCDDHEPMFSTKNN